ncbi:MAG: hypothetical protein E7678_03610 [Ruminococcaceae bacterium]|nr:hypothetical protein [Oscillospiraceae bacterium]
MNGKSFLLGYSILSSAKENAEKIINLCNEHAIPFSKIIIENETLNFCVPLFFERKFLKLAKDASIEFTVISRRGIPALIFRHRMRAGILAGLIFSVIIFIFSSNLVWDIRIDGAINIDERELRATFAECGLEIGSKLRDIDADVLENQILILSDKISWVSVNLSNNVANVEIREIDYAPPDEYGDALYSNVVASQNGIIVGFEDVRGTISVDIGDSVCKDQLLISGISGEKGSSTYLTNAHGRVFAEVEETIEIKIPKKYTKKVTKEEIKEEKSLIFFKKKINFFSNSRNLPPFYDKIDIVENFYTVNGKKLPIAVGTVKYIEYEELEFTRTQAEMLNLAYAELYRRIDFYFEDVEILSREVSIAEEEHETILVCNIRCIKNIAQIKEIIVSS